MNHTEVPSSEVMLSTSDVAKRLNVGAAMVRKWAIAYEDLTGDKVRLKSKRDGREFTSAQVDIIATAKRYVDSEGVKVETALKMVLGQTELASAVPGGQLEGSDTLQMLEAILRENNKTNELLLAEIRGLRQDLQQGTPPGKLLNPVSEEAMMQVSRPGIIVRFATWFESLLRK